MTTKGNEHKSSDDALSAILGGHPMGAGGTAARHDAADGDDDLLPEDVADQEFDVDYLDETGAGDSFAEFDADDQQRAEGDDVGQRHVYSEIRSRRAANRHELKKRKARRTGARSRVLGGLLLVAGVAVQALESRGLLGGELTDFGVDPALLLGLGSIILIVGLVRRQLAYSNYRIDELAYTHQEAQLDVQANLQYLVEHQQHHFERPPAQGEELERVLMAMERQDDKINNLSRALKMYGKPLMEIANQTSEVAAQVAALKTQLDAMSSVTRDGLSRLTKATESIDATVDLKPLQETTTKLADETRRHIRELGNRLPDTSGLQQQLVRLEASVQALAQRQEDAEMRKSLVRIEDFNKVQTKKLDELAKAEAVSTEARKLEKQLDLAIGKLGASVDQMRQKDISTLDAGLRELQRELAGVATTAAYIQQSVKSGMGAQGAAARQTPRQAAPTPAPTGPGAATTAAATADAPTAATTTPTSTPAASTGKSDAAGGGYQTGSRASSGKNVLGAIAKLKNMKK